MKLPQFLNRKTFGGERPRAPQALLYVPPQGAPVQCPSIEAAQQAAQNYAGENPGRTVAVYQLVGYAYRPIENPEFVMATSDEAKEQLIDCAPSVFDADPYDEHIATGGVDIDRSYLSPEQRETLERLRAARRGDEYIRDDGASEID